MAKNREIKILIVENLSSFRTAIKNMLAQQGFKKANMGEASDGVAAIKMLQEELAKNSPYNLVLSSWELPKKNGLELVKEIRASEDLKEVPFLMMSSDSEQSSVMTAVQAGVSNLIVKPFASAHLKEKLDKIIK